MGSIADLFISWVWVFILLAGVAILMIVLNWLDKAQSEHEEVRRFLVGWLISFARWRKWIAWQRYDFSLEKRWESRERKLMKYVVMGLQ